MSKEKLLETLFTEWNAEHENSPEYSNAGDDSIDSETLVDCVIAESQLAFTAGFNAAVELLIGGVQ